MQLTEFWNRASEKVRGREAVMFRHYCLWGHMIRTLLSTEHTHTQRLELLLSLIQHTSHRLSDKNRHISPTPFLCVKFSSNFHGAEEQSSYSLAVRNWHALLFTHPAVTLSPCNYTVMATDWQVTSVPITRADSLPAWCRSPLFWTDWLFSTRLKEPPGLS